VKARTFIITTSAVIALVAPAAHAATTTNALHCTVQTPRIAPAYPRSMGFRALQAAGKSQKPIGNRCTSKSSKSVVVSKPNLPVHRPLIPAAPAAAVVVAPVTAAAPLAAAAAAPVLPCLSVDDSYVVRGYLCSNNASLDGPTSTGDQSSVN
jgi:hypothetical protein